jgi:hypothetical protein
MDEKVFPILKPSILHGVQLVSAGLLWPRTGGCWVTFYPSKWERILFYFIVSCSSNYIYIEREREKFPTFFIGLYDIAKNAKDAESFLSFISCL